MAIGEAGDRMAHARVPVVVDCKQDIEHVVIPHQLMEEKRVLDSTKW